MSKMKLKEWAEKNGLSYITANRHFHAGLIPGAQQLDSGTILVEDDTPEPTMLGNTSNDAMSLFLKKTVEFSKNNATVEDFAAFVISNFTLKVNSVPDNPRYSRQKPKSEDVQKHFQQFIPKGEKPKPNSFVLEPDTLHDLQEVSEAVDSKELVQEFKQAILTSSVSDITDTTADKFMMQFATPTASITGGAGAMSTEGIVTRNVDLSTPQQQINYTGSHSSTFGSSLTSPITSVGDGSNLSYGGTFTTTLTNNGLCTGIDTVAGYTSGSTYLNSTLPPEESPPWVGAFQPTKKELQSTKTDDTQLHLPRRRGRKPTKR